MKKPNNKKQELGIYYTPEVVVEFIFDILNVLKSKEDREKKRWQSREPNPHYPSVIDPACGEGIFLKKAIESSFTGYHPKHKIPYVFGVDIDKTVVERWKKISILKMFNGDRQTMENHFYHQNGLEDLPERTLLYKKGGLKKYDAVVGNPPYGGIGVDISKKEHINLYNALRQFQIYNYRGKRKQKIALQQALVGEAIVGVSAVGTGESISIKEVKSIPIEILFIERFLQLCKPSGWIAIIIPDGILANSTYDYVRRFIAERAKVLGIVSLPRGAFKEAGTSAKTSILFLQKAKDKLLIKPREWNYPVFLVSVSKIEKELFDIIVKEFRSFVETGKLIMNEKNKNPKIIRYTDGSEAYMVRGDKTMEDIFKEKPSSRLDPEYWHPRYDKILEQINNNLPIKVLKDFIDFITYGVITTGARRGYDPSGEIWHINQINVRNTGLDISLDERKISKEDERNSDRARPKVGDILLNRDQVGTMGRCLVFHDSPPKYVVNDHVDIIRVENINPHYVAVYLLSIFGASQVNRYGVGVSGIIGITFEQIKSIKIPILPQTVQSHMEKGYSKMSELHNRAMGVKKRGDENGYKENLETAEKMLRDLIAKTEAVIRGEREDVL